MGCAEIGERSVRGAGSQRFSTIAPEPTCNRSDRLLNRVLSEVAETRRDHVAMAFGNVDHVVDNPLRVLAADPQAVVLTIAIRETWNALKADPVQRKPDMEIIFLSPWRSGVEPADRHKILEPVQRA